MCKQWTSLSDPGAHACAPIFDLVAEGENSLDRISTLVHQCLTTASQGGQTVNAQLFGMAYNATANQVARCLIDGGDEATCGKTQTLLLASQKGTSRIQDIEPTDVPKTKDGRDPDTTVIQTVGPESLGATPLPVDSTATSRVIQRINKAITDKDGATLAKLCAAHATPAAVNAYLVHSGATVCSDVPRVINEQGQTVSVRPCDLMTVEEACKDIQLAGFLTGGKDAEQELATKCFGGDISAMPDNIGDRLNLGMGSLCDRATNTILTPASQSRLDAEAELYTAL